MNIHTNLSKTENILCGVPQGSILCPMLFYFINDLSLSILRKIYEGYQISFDSITFERKKNPNKVFLFLIELPIFNSAKCKMKLTGSLVMIQYHTKCNNPLYRKFTSNKICCYIFCCKLDLAIACIPIPTTETFSRPFISQCT